MGQYHRIINITKSETFSFGGAKLLEKSFDPMVSTALMVLLCNSNGRGGGDLNIERVYNPKTREYEPLTGERLHRAEDLQLIQGRWAGDRIVIQGDYAEDDDPAFLSKEFQDGLKDISRLVLGALENDSELKAMVALERKIS